MKKSILITFVVICLAALCGTAFADISYEIADTFQEEAPHNFGDYQLIRVHGLSDPDEESSLNSYFQATFDGLIEQYRADVEESKTLWPDDPEGSDDGPKFGENFTSFDVTDNDDYFVFKTEDGVLGASYSWFSTYYTFDKKSGKLVFLTDYFGEGADFITPLTDYIRGRMEEYNAEHPEEVCYWLDDPSVLGDAMNNLDIYRHWYINQDGEFIVTFDKYQVAPGAFGTSEFVIPEEVLASIK